MLRKGFCMGKNYFFLIIILSFILSMSLVSAVKVKISDYNGSYYVGTTFDVKVYLIGNVKNMTGFEFDLYWNKNILNCVDATPHPEDFWSDPYSVGKGLSEGHYYVAYTVLNDKYTGWGKPLATLRFKVVGIGISPLDLRNTLLLSSRDHTVGIVRTEIVDGTFDNTVTSVSGTPLSILRAFIEMIFGIFQRPYP